ncbi:unnamed protein product [Chrysoparadoxa australica]
MLKPASVALLGCLLLLLGLILSLAARYWGRRTELMIKARKPALVMLSIGFIMVVQVGIFVQWILEVERGKGPCLLPLIITYTGGGNSCMPTLLRAIHITIMTNSTLRKKYSWMLRDKFIWGALASLLATGVLLIVILGLTSARYRPGYEGTCVLFQEWPLLMAVMATYIPIAIILIKQLGKVKDLLRMAEELTIVIVWVGILSCLYLSYLIITDVWHLPRNSLIHLISLLTSTGVSLFTLVLPFAGRNKPGIIPIQDDHGEYEKLFSSSRDICKIPTMAPILRDVVDKALCFESLDFVVAAEGFKADSFTSIEAQHSALVHVIDTFIKEGSTYEVNISSKSRALVLPFRSLEAYQALPEDERRLVLEPQCKEIAHMLDDNLLHRFYKHPDFLQAAKTLQDMENSYAEELNVIKDVIGDEP